MFEFPTEYCSQYPDRAARQIAAAWIEAVLRGNARDLHMTAGWTDAHRNAVAEELRKLQAKLDGGEPIDGAIWLIESTDSKVGTLNPNPWVSDAEQFV
jgi:hypothetical protein